MHAEELFTARDPSCAAPAKQGGNGVVQILTRFSERSSARREIVTDRGREIAAASPYRQRARPPENHRRLIADRNQGSAPGAG